MPGQATVLLLNFIFHLNQQHLGESLMAFRHSILLVLFVVLGLSTAAVAQSGELPRMVIDSANHEFGTVDSGTPLTYTFTVKNEGNADLLIKSVAPS